MTADIPTGGPSFWWRQIGPPQPRPALAGDTTAQVCIIGAGYTGLWTALSLRSARPDLDILIVEAEFAGFGASGRNGGWLTGGFAWSHARYAASSSPQAVRDMVAAMNGTVAEITHQCQSLGIDAGITPTDELLIATSPAQWQRLQAEHQHRSAWGEADRLRLLTAAQIKQRVRMAGGVGALEISGTARIQPAKLVVGLARVAAARGIRIAEGTRVTAIAPGLVITTHGRITAETILRCTEGFTATLPGHERDLLPLNSAQIITEPLPPETWMQIGWQDHEIVGDFAHSYCYCQRTPDGRIAFGGRGTPYRFGSGIDDSGRPDPATIAQLTSRLHHLFPATRDARIDHAWCGVLGVPRDWCAGVAFDPRTRIGHAGGYVGVGVATANLAGRTLAALALGTDDPLTLLPWVNRTPRRWEPEPLRWLGLRGTYAAYALADRSEARGGPPSRLAAWVNRATGR
ncbi:MAG: FAD-dependent oxidoreductase [Pseudotabrizicola sp.]|uniref:NAD(P)/FAD-dependent oxidoreductase n=1 Tax=Pseudotabrizicola sp. TaxID=2939647 RepID=UPI0027312F7D|nr:FAD-dependent oxidoreductase [Pseudotabrizicola sp.]MDP2080487.1 FAD-dependent oxidoreductase [Pseudotabrizicola sp.]MDZ7573668.1 FAD-dependent oxidoreductase [Pseudotabrizicola sp.]